MFKKIFIYLLFLFGIFLMLIHPIKDYLVSSYHPNLNISKKNKASENFNLNSVRSISLGQIIDARIHSNKIDVAGEIIIPDINLNLPIGIGLNSRTLALAAGTMKKNQQMGKGNYALAGHHMIDKNVLFSPVYNYAKPGMKIYITDSHNVYVYRIVKRKIISPYDVDVINDSKKSIITLITCNKSGEKRLLVRGDFIKKYSHGKIPSKILSYTKIKTNNHNVFKGY